MLTYVAILAYPITLLFLYIMDHMVRVAGKRLPK